MACPLSALGFTCLLWLFPHCHIIVYLSVFTPIMNAFRASKDFTHFCKSGVSPKLKIEAFYCLLTEIEFNVYFLCGQ